MNNSSLEKLSVNISNGWVLGCSILTCGMMSYAYLNGIGELPLIHMKRKYKLELQQMEKSTDLREEIMNEDKIISYYWKYYTLVFMTGISGISFVTFLSIVKK